MVVKGGIALGNTLELVIKIDYNLAQGHCILQFHTVTTYVLMLQQFSPLAQTQGHNRADKGGKRDDGTEIVPNDAQEIMDLLKDLWATGDTQKVTDGVLSATSIWGEDLHNVAGLAELVKKDLDLIQEKGMLEAVKTIL